MSSETPRLPVPLEQLVDQSAPAHAALLWREFDERRHGRAKRSRSPRVLVSLAACFLVLLGSALALSLGVNLAGRDERPLLSADRTVLPSRMHASSGYRALDLSDGSRITLARGAQLDLLETSARTVSLALRKGRVRFDVRPRGPRSWRIDCGSFSVEVVGTKFVLERRDEEVSLHVMHGAVLVRGATIPDGVQRVEAGGSLRARVAPPASVAEAALRSAPLVLPLANAPLDAEALAVPPLKPASRPRHARSADRVSEVEALFRAADEARLRGEASDAAQNLSRILERHADDPRASLAGFALARLQLSALGQPARAAENLKLALSLGLPKALLEDAYGKLADAYDRAGDAAAACDAFSEYARRFPHGERASRPPQHCQVDKTQ